MRATQAANTTLRIASLPRATDKSTNTEEFVLPLVQSKDTIVTESIVAWQTAQREECRLDAS
jgi:hypothetical protein